MELLYSVSDVCFVFEQRFDCKIAYHMDVWSIYI